MMRMMARLWAWWTHPMREEWGEGWRRSWAMEWYIITLFGWSMAVLLSMLGLSIGMGRAHASGWLIAQMLMWPVMAPFTARWSTVDHRWGETLDEEIARQKTLAEGGAWEPKEGDGGLTVADERGALSELWP